MSEPLKAWNVQVHTCGTDEVMVGIDLYDAAGNVIAQAHFVPSVAVDFSESLIGAIERATEMMAANVEQQAVRH